MTATLASLADANGDLKAVPNAIKKGFDQAISRRSPYPLAKYRLEGHKVNLVAIVNLCHPKPGAENREARKGLMAGTRRQQKDNATREARLSAAGQEQGADAEATEQLQAAAKNQAWADLLNQDQMGYFGLLRNLRNIREQAPDCLDLALAQLRDPERIRKSLVLPFRYLTALTSLPEEPRLYAAISAAAIALSNVPRLPGRTRPGQRLPRACGHSLNQIGNRANFSDAMADTRATQICQNAPLVS